MYRRGRRRAFLASDQRKLRETRTRACAPYTQPRLVPFIMVHLIKPTRRRLMVVRVAHATVVECFQKPFRGKRYARPAEKSLSTINGTIFV